MYIIQFLCSVSDSASKPTGRPGVKGVAQSKLILMKKSKTGNDFAVAIAQELSFLKQHYHDYESILPSKPGINR